MLDWLGRWDYLWQETLRGLRRGGWMNWAAASTVAVSLFLLGTSLQASWHLEYLIEQFGSQLEISVYLESGAAAAEVAEAVAQLPDAAAVTPISKETAWEDLVAELGISDIDRATQQLEGNPLTDELKVRAASPEATKPLAAQIAQLPGVEAARYVDEAIRRLAELEQSLNWIGLAVVSLLMLAAIAVITTTIRLVVVARRQEIEIAQLVGATRDWIYLPFVLQGAAFGLQGAAIACLAIGGLQRGLAIVLARQPSFLQFLARELPLDWLESLRLLAILVGFGTAVGLLGSLLAVRRAAGGRRLDVSL